MLYWLVIAGVGCLFALVVGFSVREGYHEKDRLQAPTARTSAIPEKSTRGNYIWLCIDIATFSLLLAVTIFNLTWMTYAGRLDEAGKSASGLIAVVALAFAANLLWKSILTLEPETDPLFKKKHKKICGKRK